MGPSVPTEFKYLALCFYAGSLREAGERKVWIESRVGMLKPAEQVVAERYLRNLMSGKYSVKEMQAAWRSCDGGYVFNDAGLEEFLSDVLAVLAASITK